MESNFLVLSSLNMDYLFDMFELVTWVKAGPYLFHYLIEKFMHLVILISEGSSVCHHHNTVGSSCKWNLLKDMPSKGSQTARL